MLRMDARAALAELRAILRRIQRPTPVLSAIGALQVERVQQRIRSSKTSPDLAPWSPWRDSTRAYRERKGNAGQGLLWDEGTLLESVSAETFVNGVRIGVEPFYGQFLQEGTAKMDARPFLGWAPNDDATTERLMVQYLETGIAK